MAAAIYAKLDAHTHIDIFAALQLHYSKIYAPN